MGSLVERILKHVLVSVYRPQIPLLSIKSGLSASEVSFPAHERLVIEPVMSRFLTLLCFRGQIKLESRPN